MPEDSERTPLIAVVQVAPPRQRYPHSTLRRACTTILAVILLLAVVTYLVIGFIIPDCRDHRQHGRKGPCLSKHPFFRHHSVQSLGYSQSNIQYDELLDILSTTPKEEKAKEWSKYYTSGPHLAGKNLSQAEWTRDRWQEFGIGNTEIVSYDVYVNYPLGHRLALLEKKSKSKEDEGAEDSSKAEWAVKYEAKLKEDVLDEDETSGLEDRVPTFHGYSASGNVTAPYVYVNYGTYKDFEELQAANVSLKGKIALIRYGGIFRGLKVKRAQDLGMVGAVIYTDPGDDGALSDENGNKTYPDGGAREPSSVQRGSVQYISIAPGDPTTPGYPSLPGVPRQPVDGAIPQIPSIPISYLDAIPLLKALNGYGPKASSFNKYWDGGGLGYKGVKYNIGPSPDGLELNLVNEQEYVTTPMWDVIGIINGTLQDEVVVLGNHRDAWIAGGAGDPNSGSAAMNEVIRSFGVAIAKGWKPLRTIVLASWDGEEYGLIGSTEWVEEYLPWLNGSAVAYLNVDVGTTGPKFGASAAPLLNKVLIEATHMVLSPNQTVKNQTIGDVWNKHIATMGSGSDFTAFQDFAGIPCVDMGFTQDAHSPVYHYHSNYDSFHWMDTFGDPGWHYHVAIAKLWAILAAKIVETPVIQFNATDYADGLKGYVDKVKEKAANSSLFPTSDEGEESAWSKDINLKPLDIILTRLRNASFAFDATALSLQTEIDADPLPWWKWWERVKRQQRLKAVNQKYQYLERQFLYAKGLDERPWFKHVVFAPGYWTGYAGATFPGLVESIDKGDLGGVYRWAGIITGTVGKAVKLLES
ncbi:Zn-dependent exopeptidase [Aulographum hederae CBS 113979]|uniref:Zn-dependent exopeptidase n=1 Tax=Aulographum hederae CBS 113979 TaxID=1176131 RepID=A0A6G1HBA8_9PEZI|nr:Zn-dependent exopeptidase [Aulographum hederae CBS 113979]